MSKAFCLSVARSKTVPLKHHCRLEAIFLMGIIRLLVLRFSTMCGLASKLELSRLISSKNLGELFATLTSEKRTSEAVSDRMLNMTQTRHSAT